jgi:spore maturation protein CgeB
MPDWEAFMKRIFIVADFKDELTKSIRISPRMWVKGLIRAGHDVQRFGYHNILAQLTPLPGRVFRRLTLGFMKRKADQLLAEQIKAYYPDIVFILSMKYLDATTVKTIRRAAPDAVIVGRDEDAWPETRPERLAIAVETDMVLNTSAGRFLQTYKDAGVQRCAFFPNLCDPDIQFHYCVDATWKSDMVFTGRAARKQQGNSPEREAIIKRLSRMPACRIYGSFGVPKVEGLDYFYALSGATIVLSINAVNDVSLYHSDRLINSLACGSFVLARRVPDTERLHEDGKHLRYFETEEEFFDLAGWYLKHDPERQKIAMAGMEHAHKEYNCTQMARGFVDLVTKGDCNAPWKMML